MTHEWILVQAEVGQLAAFLKDGSGTREIVPKHYIFYPAGEVCLGLAYK